MKQSELNRASRKIAKANAALWECIELINEALSDSTVQEILEQYDEDKEPLKKLVLAYMRINKKYDGFIAASMHGRDLDDFDYLTSKLSEELENQ